MINHPCMFNFVSDMIKLSTSNLSKNNLLKPSHEEEEQNSITNSTSIKYINRRQNICIPAINNKISKNVHETAQYIRYTSKNNPNQQRIIKMVEAPIDPFETPKFQHKKAPRTNSDAPVPILHSPPRKLTIKDQQDWTISLFSFFFQ